MGERQHDGFGFAKKDKKHEGGARQKNRLFGPLAPLYDKTMTILDFGYQDGRHESSKLYQKCDKELPARRQ
jgi:hypothetical protein